jgi:hypothetical protein
MAVTLTTVTMQTTADNAGMQVAKATMQDAGTVALTINATNGSVTMELDATAARKIVAELNQVQDG